MRKDFLIRKIVSFFFIPEKILQKSLYKFNIKRIKLLAVISNKISIKRKDKRSLKQKSFFCLVEEELIITIFLCVKNYVLLPFYSEKEWEKIMVIKKVLKRLIQCRLHSSFRFFVLWISFFIKKQMRKNTGDSYEIIYNKLSEPKIFGYNSPQYQEYNGLIEVFEIKIKKVLP